MQRTLYHLASLFIAMSLETEITKSGPAPLLILKSDDYWTARKFLYRCSSKPVHPWSRMILNGHLRDGQSTLCMLWPCLMFHCG